MRLLRVQIAVDFLTLAVLLLGGIYFAIKEQSATPLLLWVFSVVPGIVGCYRVGKLKELREEPHAG